jgi:hypothetical protein
MPKRKSTKIPASKKFRLLVIVTDRPARHVRFPNLTRLQSYVRRLVSKHGIEKVAIKIEGPSRSTV